MSTPRAHHYLPQTYLAEFTDSANRLIVVHIDSGKVRPSKPVEEAHQRDYYRLAEGDDLLAIEHFFGLLESRFPKVRAATLDSGVVPEDGELRAALMGFLAAQVVRVPRTLDAWDKFHGQILKKAAWYLTATPEAWAAHVEWMHEAGDPVPDVPYEEMREFVLSEDYTFTLDQNTRLGPLIQALPALAEILGKRHWTLVVAEDESPDFITSDRPVTVCWNEPPEAPWPPPALGLQATTVMFPLTKRAALIGMFEGPFPTQRASPMLVGIVNMWSASSAKRFVYGAAEDSRVTLADGQPGGRDEFLESISGSA